MKDLKVRYMIYIGDGDSKAFPTIQKAEPYGPNKIPTKGECFGHVQKRVGTRLRKFKKENGQHVLSDGKKLGGVARLTEKWINKLQNYYGLVIRQNTDNLLNMRKAVVAVLYHSSEASTTEARHQFCDKNSDWCKMRMAEKSGEIYVEKPGLPAAVRDKIMPIFRDLSKSELLEKCLHGKTQNNEGLNAFIWKRIPKYIYVGAYALEMGVCSAIMNFNSGACRMLDAMQHLQLRLGKYTKDFVAKSDVKRINKMKRKMYYCGKDRYRKRETSYKKGLSGQKCYCRREHVWYRRVLTFLLLLYYIILYYIILYWHEILNYIYTNYENILSRNFKLRFGFFALRRIYLKIHLIFCFEILTRC